MGFVNAISDVVLLDVANLNEVLDVANLKVAIEV